MLRNSRAVTWCLASATIAFAAGCAGEVSDAIREEDSAAPYDAEPSVGDVDVAIMKLKTAQCTRAAQVPGRRASYDAPVDNSGSRSCWMDRGNVSDAVMALQRALKYCWWQTHIAADGDYGPQTQEAVRTVQRMLEIKDDGVYGPQTQARMGDGFAETHSDVCNAPLG